MDTLELLEILKPNPYFKGVYAGDVAVNLKLNQNKQCFIIVNTAPKGHPGLHWVLLFKPPKGQKMVFFDSAGLDPIDYGPFMFQTVYNFSTYTKFPAKWHMLDYAIQGTDSSLCGLYCIFFAYYLSYGNSINSIVKFFTLKNKKLNDIFLQRWKKLILK